MINSDTKVSIMFLPDYVFFRAQDYEKFSNGEYKAGTTFRVGITSSNSLVMKIIGIGEDFYECEDHNGKKYAIEWDLKIFNQNQVFRKELKWVFYNILKYVH